MWSANILQQPVWAYYMAVCLLMAPAVRIFMRAGMRPHWALLLLLPWVGYIACAGVLALRKWPALEKNGSEASPGALQP